MDDLIAFLNARLDEDEAAARAVRPDQDYADSAHQERWSPARVLREVEAGRAILARYEDCLAHMEDPAYSGADEYVQVREYEDFILPNLAAAWNDHPDYRQEWKP